MKNNNRLALHRAIKRIDVTAVRKLLGLRGEKRVNIEARNVEGKTPLLYAVELYFENVQDIFSLEIFYIPPMYNETRLIWGLTKREHQELLNLTNINMNQINFVNNKQNKKPAKVKGAKKLDVLNDLLSHVESRTSVITINNMNKLNPWTKRLAEEWRQYMQNVQALLQIITMLVGAGAKLNPGPPPRTSWFIIITPFSVPGIIKQHTKQRTTDKKFINDLKSTIADGKDIQQQVRNQRRPIVRNMMSEYLPSNTVQMILQKANLSNYGPKNSGATKEMKRNLGAQKKRRRNANTGAKKKKVKR